MAGHNSSDSPAKFLKYLVKFTELEALDESAKSRFLKSLEPVVLKKDRSCFARGIWPERSMWS